MDQALYTRYNQLLNQLQDAISNVSVGAGTSPAEVTAARTAIAYPGGTPPASLSATLSSSFGEVASVLTFGADNSGVADVGAAVQAALDNYDTIYFPPGTYLSSTGFDIASNKHIYGYGAILEIASGGSLALEGSNIIVEGLTFSGSATNHNTRATGGTAMTIDATASRTNIAIVNCTFEWFGTGIGFVDPAAVDPTITINNLRIDRCTFRDLTQHAIVNKFAGAAKQSNYTMRHFRITNCHFEDIYYTSTYTNDGAIYIGGGVTYESFVIANCTATNCLTSLLSCSSNGYIDKGIISGCNFSGEPNTGSTIHNKMGLDLNGTNGLVIAGCTFYYISEECIALYDCLNFAVTGCSFRAANVGVACYEVPSTTKNCTGSITGCTFIDMEDPSGVNTSRYGILLAEIEHRVKITGCTFEIVSALAGTGIRIQDVAQPYTVVMGCHFKALARGIWMATTLDHRIIVEACIFDACTTAAIQASTLVDSDIANCRFTSCAIDVAITTTTYVRCAGNMHNASTIALQLQNATFPAVFACVFRDVGTVHDGVNKVGVSNRVFWSNNNYVGTTVQPTASLGYMQIMMVDRTIQAGSASQPGTGLWRQGDLVWNRSPAAAGTVGWICVSGDGTTLGTWKTFGTIAA